MILLRNVIDRFDELRTIVCYDLSQTAPSAQYILKKPIAEGRTTLLAKHPELGIMGQRTAALYEIFKTARPGKVHGIGIHFREHWRRNRDGRGNEDIAYLPELT